MNDIRFTTEQARHAMRKTLERVGEIAKDPIAGGAVRTLAAGIALLIVAVDARLSALEPCPDMLGAPHRWSNEIAPMCVRCGVRK